MKRTTNAGKAVGKEKDSLLVAVQTGAATVEISVTLPQKASNRSTTLANYVILGYIPKGLFCYRDTCSSGSVLFFFFIIAREWKQPKRLPADVWTMKMWFTFTEWNIGKTKR